VQSFPTDQFHCNRRLLLTQGLQVRRFHTRIIGRRRFGGLFGKGWCGCAERHAKYCSPKKAKKSPKKQLPTAISNPQTSKLRLDRKGRQGRKGFKDWFPVLYVYVFAVSHWMSAGTKGAL
jgi:hypothetical protein